MVLYKSGNFQNKCLGKKNNFPRHDNSINLRRAFPFLTCCSTNDSIHKSFTMTFRANFHFSQIFRYRSQHIVWSYGQNKVGCSCFSHLKSYPVNQRGLDLDSVSTQISIIIINFGYRFESTGNESQKTFLNQLSFIKWRIG